MAADEPSPPSPADRPTPGGVEDDSWHPHPDDAWRPDWDPQRRVVAAEQSPGAHREPDRRGPSRAGVVARVLVLALVVAAGVVLLTIGSGSPADDPTSDGPTTPALGTPISGGSTPDPAALAATRRVFDQVNAEAGAAPARQRSVLDRVVAPQHRADQLGCAAAGTTVRLLPAWSDVRVAADGHLIVPSLVRVFTGTRITGTDVAIIDVTITAGQAGLPALCVS